MDTEPGRPPELLRGRGLVLARWREADMPALHTEVTASRRHLSPWLAWASDGSAAALAGFVRESRERWGRRERFEYGIWSPERGATLLGGVGLMARIGPGGLEIGYWVGERHTRQGVATRGTAALAAAAFALPGVERLEIHHDEANLASSRVPAALGFRRVGVFPRAAAAAPGETGRDVRWRMRADEFPASAAAAMARAR